MLYNKYRPKNLEEFLGNHDTVESIRAILKGDRSRMPHTILLHGPTGCGKTTLARIIARELVGEYYGRFVGKHPFDFVEFDAYMYKTHGELFESGQSPVAWFDLFLSPKDSLRLLGHYYDVDPLTNTYKVFLFEEAHALSHNAQDALLKFFENTPYWVYIILCTTEPRKLLPTFRNRCSEFQVEPLSYRQVMHLLDNVCEKEGKHIPSANLKIIADKVNGCPRQALVELEKIIDRDSDSLKALIDAEKPINISDIFEVYISSMCEESMGARISHVKLHEVYGEFCMKNGYKIESKIAFWKWLNKKYKGDKKIKLIRNGNFISLNGKEKQGPVIVGLKLK